VRKDLLTSIERRDQLYFVGVEGVKSSRNCTLSAQCFKYVLICQFYVVFIELTKYNRVFLVDRLLQDFPRYVY